LENTNFPLLITFPARKCACLITKSADKNIKWKENYSKIRGVIKNAIGASIAKSAFEIGFDLKLRSLFINFLFLDFHEAISV
jgi:hypothetical protein